MLEWSARTLAERLRRGEVSAVDAVEAHLARIDEVNPRLNAVVVTRRDEAVAEAREADRRRAAGAALGPLHGVPITIKECLDLAGTPSTFGLPSRRAHRADADDPYVARLRAAGAIVLGKTNVAQLLIYYESDNPVYGLCRNPWDLERTPGGSSGGQAAIVAAGGSRFGLGTDIGGSCRIPAAYSGVVGFKATAGRFPDVGRHSVPFGQRAIVSQVGLLARSVDDAALALDVLGADAGAVDLARLRVGVFVDDGLVPVSAAYRRAVADAADMLRARGAAVVDLAWDAIARAPAIFNRLLIADRFAGMTRTLGRDPRDPRVRRLELMARTGPRGRAALGLALRLSGRRKAAAEVAACDVYDADGYWRSCEEQLDYQARALAALDAQALDLVLSPPTAFPALRHGATAEVGICGAYACLYNVLGWPAGVVPVTRVRPDEETATARGRDPYDRTAAATERGSAGLPIAVQLAARPHREAVVLAAMAAVEAAARARPDFPAAPPPP